MAKKINTSVAKSIFDSHIVVRKKIEAANFAVVEELNLKSVSNKDFAVQTAIESRGQTLVCLGQPQSKAGA